VSVASPSVSPQVTSLTTACAVQITLETRDVFIECTATDLAKANIVVNTVATMFSEYCSTPFEVEPVEVVDALGESQSALRSLHGISRCS